MPESPSIFGRMRAGLAATFARLSAGAHRMEGWTSRMTRPSAIVLVAVLALGLGVVGVATGGFGLMGGHHRGPFAAWAHAGPPPGGEGGRFAKPDGGRGAGPDGGRFAKPDGGRFEGRGGDRAQRPDGRPAGKSEGGSFAKPAGKPEGKPHAPAPPPPPQAPPAPTP